MLYFGVGLAYSSLYHEQGVVNLTVQRSPLPTPPPGRWHPCRSGPPFSPSLLLELSWQLHGGLLWIFFWQKKTSSLLKAFLLCEQRGWGAAGWRLLFPSVHFGVLGWQVSRAFRTMETKAFFFFCSMQVNSHKRTTAPPASINSTKAALHSPSSQPFLVNTTSP